MAGDGGTRVGPEASVFDAFQRLLEELERHRPLPAGSDPRPSPLQSASVRAPRESPERNRTVEVTETSTHVHVTIDIPALARGAVSLEALPRALAVRLTGRGAEYEARIPLPTAVRVDSLRATDRNGVLDVSLEKAARGA